jgi:hypothetical protein
VTDSRTEAALLELASAADDLAAVKRRLINAYRNLDGTPRGRVAGALAYVYRALGALAEIEARLSQTEGGDD